jgi:hypothetical protein
MIIPEIQCNSFNQGSIFQYYILHLSIKAETVKRGNRNLYVFKSKELTVEKYAKSLFRENHYSVFDGKDINFYLHTLTNYIPPEFRNRQDKWYGTTIEYIKRNSNVDGMKYYLKLEEIIENCIKKRYISDELFEHTYKTQFNICWQ